MSNPILALIPSGYKGQTTTLPTAPKVFSVLPSDGSGDFDFDRANGLATRINKDGLIEEVANDTPRLDYTNSTCPSLLLESESTNLQFYSQEFQQQEYDAVGVTVTANGTTSPSGEVNADKISRTTTGANYIRSILSKAAVALEYTSSIFVKQGEGDYFAFRAQGNYADRIDVTFQFSTKSIVSTNEAGAAILRGTSVKELANGWFRISFSYLSDTATTLQNFFAARSTSANVDSNDPSTTAFIYLWGAMREQSTTLSSYIPTLRDESQTRFKDICKEGGDSTLFDITEGSFFIDVLPYNSGLVSTISLSNNSTSQRILIQFQSNGTQVRLFSSGSVSNYQTITFNQRNKILVTFKLNEYKFYINGALVSTDTSATVPTSLDRLNFSNSTANSDFFQGEVNDTRVYDTVLTQAEAIKLTT